MTLSGSRMEDFLEVIQYRSSKIREVSGFLFICKPTHIVSEDIERFDLTNCL